MTKPASERTLNELVAAVVGAGDPTLYDRACHALSALLGEHDDAADGWLI